MKPGLWDEVIERDAHTIWEWLSRPGTFVRWRHRQRIICIVPMLEPTNRHVCSGKQTVDHVKDEPMMGKRAPDDLRHLLAMCEGHNVWFPPSKALRQAEREHLRLS